MRVAIRQGRISRLEDDVCVVTSGNGAVKINGGGGFMLRNNVAASSGDAALSGSDGG